ncbi:MAG: hypothetical protein AAF511_08070, partial [Pseudomonadota bacterium]
MNKTGSLLKSVGLFSFLVVFMITAQEALFSLNAARNALHSFHGNELGESQHAPSILASGLGVIILRSRSNCCGEYLVAARRHRISQGVSAIGFSAPLCLD